uniref:Uncharacterized protein n=1 Tax=Siphoviridae sp. ct4F219 TaxID=2825329 RepID=A0A8S5PWK8_9CAUD|nr:MAG TPA: hypothetical protein [Siphoviridae sp. ct4F219]
MATSTRAIRALQVWNGHEHSTQGDSGAAVVHVPQTGGGSRPAGRTAP